jgi:transposase
VGNQLHYVHVACTEFLTAMHTGDRTKEAIDAGGILPGYAGTIVRDGCKGYEHVTDALHAWCGAHGLRDLAGLYRFDRHGQVWARSVADLLIDANAAATAATWPGPGQTGPTARSWRRLPGCCQPRCRASRLVTPGTRSHTTISDPRC